MKEQRNPLPMRPNHKGLTLIEIVVVIGAIGILLGIAIPAYDAYRQKTKTAEAKQVLKDIERAIIALGTDTGEWPGHQKVGWVKTNSNEIYDLSAASCGLVTNDTSPNEYSPWRGPYITEIPKDPWGHDYFFDTDYTIDGDFNIVLGSFGAVDDATAILNKNQYEDTDIRLILDCKRDAAGDCLEEP